VKERPNLMPSRTLARDWPNVSEHIKEREKSRFAARKSRSPTNADPANDPSTTNPH